MVCVCVYLGWLAETQTKRWPTMSPLKVPDMSWFNVEGIQRFGKIEMLE